KVRTTRNCPATTIGIVQMKAGPAVARPKAKSVYTPTTGERYVNPSEKLLQSPSARVNCCLYPTEANCSASARPPWSGRSPDATAPTKLVQGGIIGSDVPRGSLLPGRAAVPHRIGG